MIVLNMQQQTTLSW